MNQKRNEILKANTQISRINELKSKFLETVKAKPATNDLPSKLEFIDQSIAVNFAGYKAEAVSRLVQTSDSNFSIEYVFLVKEGDTQIEVWRFYLLFDGRLAESLDGQNSFCDFNNTYAAKYLCVYVLNGMLHSELFKIYPKQKI